jgi:hypothetical protein
MNGHFAHCTQIAQGKRSEACMDDDDADSRANRWRTEKATNTLQLDAMMQTG